MVFGDQPSRPPTKGAAHYRHAKAAQQRGDEVSAVQAKRQRLLAVHRAKMAAQRGARVEALQVEPAPVAAAEPA